MAYHSSFNGEKDIRTVCGFGLLPIKTKQRGPAPLQRDETKPDIIDEAIEFYRANVLFRNYEVQGPADRVLLYLTLYISQCLQKIANLDKNGANGALYQLAIENFAIPGDANFALKGITTDPTSRADAVSNCFCKQMDLSPCADLVRQYLTQLRQETGIRLLEVVYKDNTRVPSKWWIMWNKRKFLNRAL